MPNAERDWEDSFIGEQVNTKHRNRNSRIVQTVERATDNFEEGNDKMMLIEGTIDEPKIAWREEDDALLNTLCDRQCPIEVIASVFKKEVLDIQERINALDIKFENPQ